jgi:hypothetical protein
MVCCLHMQCAVGRSVLVQFCMPGHVMPLLRPRSSVTVFNLALFVCVVPGGSL